MFWDASSRCEVRVFNDLGRFWRKSVRKTACLEPDSAGFRSLVERRKCLRAIGSTRVHARERVCLLKGLAQLERDFVRFWGSVGAAEAILAGPAISYPAGAGLVWSELFFSLLHRPGERGISERYPWISSSMLQDPLGQCSGVSRITPLIVAK